MSQLEQKVMKRIKEKQDLGKHTKKILLEKNQGQGGKSIIPEKQSNRTKRCAPM